MRVAFFTAGNMGAGHLVRGLAIGRGLARAGFNGEYRMFGPAQPFASRNGNGRPASFAFTTVEIAEEALRSSSRAESSDVANKLAAWAPDLLLIDMFWAPLRHVLPVLTTKSKGRGGRATEAWLLLRSYPPTWLEGPPGLPFEPAQFERIIAIEPHLSSLMITHRIDPIVILNPDECQRPGALRQRLHAPPHEDHAKLIAVAHAGKEGELDEIHNAARRSHPNDERIVSFSLFDQANELFPIAGWLGDCDAIYAAAGYNAFWEAHWLAYAERTTWTAFERRNDNQPWRVSKCSGHVMKANGADTLAAEIVGGQSTAGWDSIG